MVQRLRHPIGSTLCGRRCNSPDGGCWRQGNERSFHGSRKSACYSSYSRSGYCCFAQYTSSWKVPKQRPKGTLRSNELLVQRRNAILANWANTANINILSHCLKAYTTRVTLRALQPQPHRAASEIGRGPRNVLCRKVNGPLAMSTRDRTARPLKEKQCPNTTNNTAENHKQKQTQCTSTTNKYTNRVLHLRQRQCPRTLHKTP